LRRADLFTRLQMLAVLLLAGCSSSPRPPPEPHLRIQAQELEASGVRRHAQGDYSAAARHFAAAAQLQLSMDDMPAASHNRLQQAQSELALGQAQLALDHASQVHEDKLQISALQLQVQAQLALGRMDAAQPLLARLIPLCAAGCTELGSVLLLRARTAWAGGDTALALTQAEAALPILSAQHEEREIANAWRLIAAARLKTGDTIAALAAARSALDIDRQLALPEKIARDWLLIGDIQRRSSGPNATAEASAAYLRAQSVAQAAGLQELAKLAAKVIAESSQ
jgi:hypothetical protein